MAKQTEQNTVVSTDKVDEALDHIYKHFKFIYGNRKAEQCVERFKKTVDKYDLSLNRNKTEESAWTERDVLLITYGDSIVKKDPGQAKLQILKEFLDNYLSNAITSLHILPFFPFSSDGGFSVIDYKKVREDLGSWDDIEELASQYKLMADLVINHISSQSQWFQNFIKREEPGKNYFHEVDPESDLSTVTRPRSSPLLTEVETDEGKRYVWTTFSEDQIDLDFSNPDVLIEIIDIFLFYLSKGVQIVRLDAIAYLWKHVGSNSIHEPETHEIVKLFRDIVEYTKPSTTLITETNVPFEENVSYFGEGDEAHMVYQFSLPPLLLHAILTENAKYLSQWVENLPEPPKGCTYFNFTSSHDGIGVRPLEGLVPEEEFYQLVEGAKERGGFVSYKRNPDGTESPYELNITYFDALRDIKNNDVEVQYRRYICSQMLMMSLQGLPAFYIHNLTGTRNDHESVIETRQKRDINRKKWEYSNLIEKLENEDDTTHKVFYMLKELIKIRKRHPAFSPQASQKVLKGTDDLFLLLRNSHKEKEKVLVAGNVTGHPISLKSDKAKKFLNAEKDVTDLVTGKKYGKGDDISIDPYRVLWLK